MDNDIWIECDHCDKLAQYYDLHVGCDICGGECGDTSYAGFHCGAHAQFFHVYERIPLCCVPLEYCYELLDTLTTTRKQSPTKRKFE